MWLLIVSIPDLCTLTYLKSSEIKRYKVFFFRIKKALKIRFDIVVRWLRANIILSNYVGIDGSMKAESIVAAFVLFFLIKHNLS